MLYLLLYLAVANLVAFVLMGVDKQKAKRGAWRISEKTLFLAAALGGSVGAIGGMFAFRHKTRHPSFRIGLPAILAVQIAGAILLWYFQ